MSLKILTANDEQKSVLMDDLSLCLLQSVEDLKAGTDRANTPGGLKIYDAPSGQKGPFTDEYTTFIDSFPKNGSSEVDLYFLLAAYAGFGIAVTINDLPVQEGEVSYEYVDKAFVHDLSSPRSQTPPHELLHVLAPESPGDADMPHYHNVLSYGGGGDDTVYGRRRIFQEQEEMIDGHPSVKEP
ncbi:MAG: hypothetical protein AB7V57_20730 [Verrucomicrobiales bacterium]